MPTRKASGRAPLMLVFGDDDFAVKQSARRVFDSWCAEAEGGDHEIIDGQVGNSGEALRSIGRLREALQTLPFFGGGKVVWWRGVTFLGEDRTSTSQAVTAALAELAQEIKAFDFPSVKLVISAGKVDKRKVFYKAVDQTGDTEAHLSWTPDSRTWHGEAEALARQTLQAQSRRIGAEALAALVDTVGPNRPQLVQELEKLFLHAGERDTITLEDVQSVVTRNKQSRAFALGDALGDRDLPRLVRTLDEELWELQVDRKKSEIGLLYGLITKVRMMIFVEELQREKLLEGAQDYGRFKAQLDRIPSDRLPQDRRFNPLAMNPYPLYRAMQQARHYTIEELIQAMDKLLDCNQQLIFSGLEGGLVLQQTLVQIVSRRAAA